MNRNWTIKAVIILSAIALLIGLPGKANADAAAPAGPAAAPAAR